MLQIQAMDQPETITMFEHSCSILKGREDTDNLITECIRDNAKTRAEFPQESQ